MMIKKVKADNVVAVLALSQDEFDFIWSVLGTTTGNKIPRILINKGSRFTNIPDILWEKGVDAMGPDYNDDVVSPAIANEFETKYE